MHCLYSIPLSLLLAVLHCEMSSSTNSIGDGIIPSPGNDPTVKVFPLITETLPNMNKPDLMSAGVTCSPGEYIFNDTDTRCKTCPAGKFRSIPTLWAPMRVAMEGGLCKYQNRMYMNQPTYQCDIPYHGNRPKAFWWFWYAWFVGSTMPCVDGCNCWCSNGAYYTFATTGENFFDGQYPPIRELLKATTNPEYCLDCPENLVCAAGTYISYRCDNGKAAECTRCPSDTYTSIANQASCETCAVANGYVTESGIGRTTACPFECNAGYAKLGSVCAPCLTCPNGEYVKDCRGNSTGSCTSCINTVY